MTVVALEEDPPESLGGEDAVAELKELSGRDTGRGHLPDEALDIAHRLDDFADGVAGVGVAEEVFHGVEAMVDGVDVEQGEEETAAEHTGSHRGGGLVDDVEQAHPLLCHRLDELEVADGEPVEADISVLFDASQGGDVAELGVARLVHIVEDASGGDYGLRHVVHSESLQRCCAEMPCEPLAGGLVGIHPVVELVGGAGVGEGVVEEAAGAMHPQDFAGGDVVEEFVDIFP